MNRTQSLVVALLGAVLMYLGNEGDSPLHHLALVVAGVYLCAAFTVKE